MKIMTNSIILVFVSIFYFVPFSFAQEDGEAPAPKAIVCKERQVIGIMEKVKVFPGELLMHAKIQPGLRTSSIYVENMRRVRKGKKILAIFEMADQYGNEAKAMREIVRSVKIKGGDGKTREEFVVVMGMCLGKKYFEEEISLTSQQHDEYEIKLGRQTLEGNVLVDPGSKYITGPDCGEKGKDLKVEAKTE